MSAKNPESKCGACVAGVVIDHVNGIQRCDDCKLFEDDPAAAMALWDLWVRTYPELRVKKGTKS